MPPDETAQPSAQGAPEQKGSSSVPKDIQEWRSKKTRFSSDAPPAIIGAESDDQGKTPPKNKPEEPEENEDLDLENDPEDENSDTPPDSEHSQDGKAPEAKPKEQKEEKRYRDIQAAFTKSQQENQKLKKLLTRFDKYLKRNESGDPEDWDFSTLNGQDQNKKPPAEKPEEIPPEPTDEDFDLNPRKAAAMQVKREIYLFKKELNEERSKEREESEKSRKENEAKAQFDTEWAKSFDQAVEEYPDVANKESPFVKRMIEVCEENPALEQLPNANLVVARMVGAEMGILPQKKGAPPKQPNVIPKPKIGNKTLLTQPVRGGSNSTPAIPDDVKSWRDKKTRFAYKGNTTLMV